MQQKCKRTGQIWFNFVRHFIFGFRIRFGSFCKNVGSFGFCSLKINFLRYRFSLFCKGKFGLKNDICIAEHSKTRPFFRKCRKKGLGVRQNFFCSFGFGSILSKLVRFRFVWYQHLHVCCAISKKYGKSQQENTCY